MICLVYVNDCLFFAQSNADIDRVITDLKKPSIEDHKSFLLDEEDGVAGFLGVLFEKIKNSAGKVCQIKLLQTGLINFGSDRHGRVLNYNNSS